MLSRKTLLLCPFFVVLLAAAPAGAQAKNTNRIYDIVFEGRGTYSASATGTGTAFFDSMEQEISMAWRTPYSYVFWDEGTSDPLQSLATGTPEFSGELIENGMSTRECDSAGAYSCRGPVGTCGLSGDIYVMNALTPGYQFSIDAFDSLGVCYDGDVCSGCYTAYTAQRGDLPEDAFTAYVTMAPGDLKRGKTIYYVSGPKLALPECTSAECPTCAHSFSWTGEVAFTLISDSLPPYVTPTATTFKASKAGKFSMKLEAAHKQVGPASGTVTLSGKYGKGSFKIAHDGASGTAKISLSPKAKKLLKKKRKLTCKATIKAKDHYGTAAEKVTITIQL